VPETLKSFVSYTKALIITARDSGTSSTSATQTFSDWHPLSFEVHSKRSPLEKVLKKLVSTYLSSKAYISAQPPGISGGGKMIVTCKSF